VRVRVDVLTSRPVRPQLGEQKLCEHGGILLGSGRHTVLADIGENALGGADQFLAALLGHAVLGMKNASGAWWTAATSHGDAGGPLGFGPWATQRRKNLHSQRKRCPHALARLRSARERRLWPRLIFDRVR
jgi:hypothetical protein